MKYIINPNFTCFASLNFYKIFLCGPFLKSLVNLLQILFLLYVLVEGIEPIPPAVEGEVLTNRPLGKS